jgi:hypothetical protein
VKEAKERGLKKNVQYNDILPLWIRIQSQMLTSITFQPYFAIVGKSFHNFCLVTSVEWCLEEKCPLRCSKKQKNKKIIKLMFLIVTWIYLEFYSPRESVRVSFILWLIMLNVSYPKRVLAMWIQNTSDYRSPGYLI